MTETTDKEDQIMNTLCAIITRAAVLEARAFSRIPACEDNEVNRAINARLPREIRWRALAIASGAGADWMGIGYTDSVTLRRLGHVGIASMLTA